MRKIKEIGNCPKCECSLTIFKTANYKRFAKCEACGVSYALPKRGKLSNSAVRCPQSGFPILIVEKADQKTYFWADQPCFSCVKLDKCRAIEELETEFKELEVYGY
jgi:ssDNA-binding Zn-finger/Zn-ribbon topoisomerase 1